MTAGRGELIAKIGTIVSAIVASSCCWLPPILLLVGISGAGMTRAIEQYRPLMIAVTFGFLTAAFYFTYRPRWRVAANAAGSATGSSAADCCAPAQTARRFNMMTMNKIMLWMVTGLAVVFLFFPQVFTRFFAGNELITADMDLVRIKIAGMTCEG